ncbi:ATP-binding protein [Devosia rhizoryzae]|uniref:ATP-binding protein n=1 Tax=Devosia rhizoryzae TaxID=2774137 RepID=A0ABX7C449_9HYPH|nr:ATP-binding protein [Devosia rhizoryzae]QQR39003.1 ATP-binding protein [Devosia rhizoryzae]
MPEKHQAAGNVLDCVNAVYVESPRDTILRNSFDRFLGYVMADQRHGRRGKGNAFFITGQSGAGKTDIVENLLAAHPVMQPAAVGVSMVRPWVQVSLQGPATLGVLGRQIMSVSGYDVKPTMRENTVWELLPGQLEKAKVLLVHIDETQHLMSKGAATDKVASALKGLMNHKPWPVSFILSGMPKINELKVQDEQAERRNFSLALAALHPEADIDLIVEIIKKHCEAADMKCAALIATDMPKRIAHAANYQFGRICEVVISGIHHALLAGDKELLREHFAKAYRDHSNTRGLDDLNPFHADDFLGINAGYFSISAGDHT